jgi:tRNA (guanine26-N2/guanine27-N2)-dimethyltransferase
MQVQEGRVICTLGHAFYRSSSRRSRDLGILAAQVYRQTQPTLRLFDGMSGCGIRALRYLVEAAADFAWINDADPDVQATLKENLRDRPESTYRITQQSAQRALIAAIAQGDYFDVIDLDAFGNPLPYLGVALQALRIGGLLYVTSTDGRSLSGQLPHQSMQQWGSYARSHPAVHEQALRILIGAIHQQAIALGLGIVPIVAFYQQSVFRVMVQLQAKPTAVAAKQPIGHYGFLGYCHHCGNFQPVDWRQLGHVSCLSCQARPTVSGPLWLGELHHAEWLNQMRLLAEQQSAKQQSAEQQNAKQEHHGTIAQWLKNLSAEIGLPAYFYTLGEVGRRGHCDIPPRDRLATVLTQAGYHFGPTHITPEGFKTNASMATCLDLLKAD